MKLYTTKRLGSVKVKERTRKEDRSGTWITSPGIWLKFNYAWQDRDPVTNMLRNGPEVIDTENPGPGNMQVLKRGYGEEKDEKTGKPAWKVKYDLWWQGLLDEGKLTKARPKREVVLKLSEAEMARVLEDRRKAASEEIADDEPEQVVMSRGVRTKQGARKVGAV